MFPETERNLAQRRRDVKLFLATDGRPFSRLRDKVAGGAGRMRADERGGGGWRGRGGAG